MKILHKNFLLLGLLPIVSIAADDVTTLPDLDVSAEAGVERPEYAGVEIAPSTSTLDSDASEIQLNILELQGVAGTQGDPLGALKTLPGISASPAGGVQGGGFFVRGSNPNDNTITIDDMPVGYIFHLGELYSVVNPDLIDNFATYLGGFSVKYGDQLGGVVDVKTRQPYAEGTQQSYQLGFYDASARIEGRVSKKGSAFFAIRRSYIDLLLPATGSLGDSDNTYTQFPRFWDMQAKYRHELKNGFWDWSLFTADDALEIQIKDDDTALRDPAALGDLTSDDEFQTTGFRWYKTLAPGLEQKLRLGVIRELSDFKIGTQQATDPDPGESFGFNLVGKTWFFLPRWEWSKGQRTWVFGADFNYYDFDLSGYLSAPPEEGDPDYTLTETNASVLDQKFTGSGNGVYLELDQPLSERFFARVGLRGSFYDFADQPYSELSPRLALEYDVSPEFILTASWGRFLQIPSGAQISKSIGNPALDITEAEHRILGLKYEWNSLWSSQLEVYEKPMKHLVVPRDAPENFANDGEGLARGVDVLVKRRFEEGRFGWFSYSYLESTRKDLAEGRDRVFDGEQPHNVNFVWTQPFGGNWSNWTWGANLKIRSGQPYTEVVGVERLAVPGSGQADAACAADAMAQQCYYNPIYGPTNARRLPLGVRLDLSAERKVQRSNYSLQYRFELLNVTSLLYPDGNVVGYEYAADYSNFNDPDKVSGFPFLPSFSVRANF
ncbi:MAG: TonB-dependent receptor plug domain-containing protein [Thiotrichales bacterium]